MRIWEWRIDDDDLSSVIPGRAEGASPESSATFGVLLWIPGPALRAVPE
jgi:hypothetical protein